MIDKEAFEIQTQRLVYSQNMLNYWKRSKKEFTRQVYKAYF